MELLQKDTLNSLRKNDEAGSQEEILEKAKKESIQNLIKAFGCDFSITKDATTDLVVEVVNLESKDPDTKEKQKSQEELDKIKEQMNEAILWILRQFKKEKKDRFFKKDISEPFNLVDFHYMCEIMSLGGNTEDWPVMILQSWFNEKKENLPSTNLAELTLSPHLQEIALPAWEMLKNNNKKDNKIFPLTVATNSPHLKEIALPALQLIKEKKELCSSSVFVAMACSQHLQEIALPAWSKLIESGENARSVRNYKLIIRKAKTEHMRELAKDSLKKLLDKK